VTEPASSSEVRGPTWTATAIGGAAATYLRAIAPKVTVAAGASMSLASLRAVRDRHPDRKLVVFYWIRDVLPMMLVDWKQRLATSDPSEDIQFVCDDSYGGRVAESVLRRLGRRTQALRWQRPLERIRDVQRILRSKAPMGIAVDGHGPYGQVGETFARLLSGSATLAVPVSAVARPSWVMPLRSRLLLPAPRAMASLSLGAPILADHERPTSAEELQRALESVRATADAAAEPNAAIRSRPGCE
jgi:hypothetical protein